MGMIEMGVRRPEFLTKGPTGPRGSESHDQDTNKRSRTRSRTRESCFIESELEKIFDGRTYPDDFEENEKIDAAPKVDDDDHMCYLRNHSIMNKYRLELTIGEGAFGKVVSAKDLNRNRHYAIKIVKNVKKYRKSARYEILILKKISNSDQSNKYCIELKNHFVYFGHACLVFRKYGISVYEFMKLNSFFPFPTKHAINISYQLCAGIKFLHGLNIIHTDLKPENMVFVDDAFTVCNSPESRVNEKILHSSDIKIIDFGNGIFEDDDHSTTICTRHYRPPEVILELGYNRKVDVWSAGCIMFEVYTGVTMFKAHSNLEHLFMIEVILGKIPQKLIQNTKKTKYFKRNRPDWDALDSDEQRHVRKCKFLEDYFESNKSEDSQMVDILDIMLEIDPGHRQDIRSCLKHNLFDNIPH